MSDRDRLLLDIPEQIDSQRLILRCYTEGDGEALFELLERNDNREFLKEHVDEATDVQTLDEAEIRVRELRLWWIARKRFVLGIWLKGSNDYIGNIWIEPDKWENPSFQLGYFIDKGYTRKGYAKEAGKRAVKFIFEDLHATKIRLFTRDTNIPSYKLAESLGFIKEGHDRENIKHEGKMIGLFHYGMLKREYLKNPDYNK